jgi:hypothetical protein
MNPAAKSVGSAFAAMHLMSMSWVIASHACSAVGSDAAAAATSVAGAAAAAAAAGGSQLLVSTRRPKALHWIATCSKKNLLSPKSVQEQSPEPTGADAAQQESPALGFRV